MRTSNGDSRDAYAFSLGSASQATFSSKMLGESRVCIVFQLFSRFLAGY